MHRYPSVEDDEPLCVEALDRELLDDIDASTVEELLVELDETDIDELLDVLDELTLLVELLDVLDVDTLLIELIELVDVDEEELAVEDVEVVLRLAAVELDVLDPLLADLLSTNW